MRVLLVVNSVASSVTARARVVIQKAISADHDVTLAETSRRGHATRLAQGAAREGYEAVVVLGGDGTLNEAANGLVGSDVALGVLPGGSTNVFARTIGMTNDPIEATGELLSAMGGGPSHRRRIGVGSVNGRYFLFHVGVGFDAAVVEQVEKRSSLKRWAGHPLFVYAAFATWFRHYEHSTPRFDVAGGAGDGAGTEGYFSLCLNSNPYTYLGNLPFEVAPDTDLDNGLTIITFKNLRFLTVIRAAASALRGGKGLPRQRGLDRKVDIDHAVITGRGPFPYQVDGDFLGETERLELRHHPACLDLFVPGT